MPQGLPRKLRRVFVLQAVLVVATVVACLYVSTLVGRGMLAPQWVRAEADRFWQEAADNPGTVVPGTSAMQGYFVPAGTDPATTGVPDAYLESGPGIHRLQARGASQRLLVEDGPGGRLYIRVAFPLLTEAAKWSLLLASLLSALSIGVVSWLSYRIARRMVLPLTALAGEVAAWDPRQPDLDAIAPAQLPGEVGREVRMLEGALRGLAERTQAFIRRERDFTREASHELRTPLTVVRGAADMLRRDPDLPQRMQRSMDRVQVAARDMEAVVDALLILAREDEPAHSEEFDAVDVAAEAVAIGQALLAELPEPPAVELALLPQGALKVHGSRRALAVILEQLVRNACTFTPEGRIDVHVADDRIEVRDTGVGMERDVLERVFEPFYRADQYVGGRGLGLAIVRRLAGRFGWAVDIDSTPGQGTNVSVHFRSPRGE